MRLRLKETQRISLMAPELAGRRRGVWKSATIPDHGIRSIHSILLANLNEAGRKTIRLKEQAGYESNY